jgi:hypothetical protein
MPDGEFFPPVQYQPWWGLLGFLIIVVVVAWYVWLFVSTRASKAPKPEPAPQPMRAPSPEVIRAHYLGLISETRAAHASGRLESREAHHQLSLLLRSYVDAREGVQTLHMTLKDLRTTPLTPLTDAVARLYPGAFSPDPSGSVDDAVAEAQRVVNSWR